MERSEDTRTICFSIRSSSSSSSSTSSCVFAASASVGAARAAASRPARQACVCKPAGRPAACAGALCAATRLHAGRAGALVPALHCTRHLQFIFECCVAGAPSASVRCRSNFALERSRLVHFLRGALILNELSTAVFFCLGARPTYAAAHAERGTPQGSHLHGCKSALAESRVPRRGPVTRPCKWGPQAWPCVHSAARGQEPLRCRVQGAERRRLPQRSPSWASAPMT